MFFYLDTTGKQAGPVAKDELISCGVTAETLVWKAGMEQWQKAKEVSELQSIFAPTAPASPSQEPEKPYIYPSLDDADDVSVPEEEKPHNYLPLAIVALIMFFPFGIPSICYATKVDNLYANGDVQGAWEIAQKARGWGKSAIVFTAIFWSIYIIVYTVYICVMAAALI